MGFFCPSAQRESCPFIVLGQKDNGTDVFIVLLQRDNRTEEGTTGQAQILAYGTGRNGILTAFPVLSSEGTRDRTKKRGGKIKFGKKSFDNF